MVLVVGEPLNTKPGQRLRRLRQLLYPRQQRAPAGGGGGARRSDRGRGRLKQFDDIVTAIIVEGQSALKTGGKGRQVRFDGDLAVANGLFKRLAGERQQLGGGDGAKQRRIDDTVVGAGGLLHVKADKALGTVATDGGDGQFIGAAIGPVLLLGNAVAAVGRADQRGALWRHEAALDHAARLNNF